MRSETMDMQTWMKMTPNERVFEPGDELDCPFCQNPRVTRSDYIRCNHCGMNWLSDRDVFKHPHTKVIASAMLAGDNGAQTVRDMLSKAG
jgi:hypothetical protein